MAPGPARSIRGRPSRCIPVIVAIGAFFGVLTALLRSQAGLQIWRQHAEAQDSALLVRKQQILQEAAKWNAEAAVRGLPADLHIDLDPAVGHGTPPGGQAIRSARVQCPPPQPASSCHEDIPSLEAPPDAAMVQLLRKVSIDNEVMLALANGVMICQNVTICWWGGGNILKSWLQTMRHAGITNYAIAVLDDETEKYLREEEHEHQFFRPKMEIPKSQQGSHPANQVSTLKYGLVKQMLQLQYSVLVADMDLVLLKNPFRHLHRDSDLESQTDGFTESWSYGQFGGITDKSMGWGGGGLYLQVFTLNVGFIFIRPNKRTVDLMTRIHNRLVRTPGWDQQLFNEEALFPSHGEYQGSQVSIRVMDIFKFMNSKIFFKTSRKRYLPGKRQDPEEFPVVIHMNYHPDKHKRMLCLMERYIKRQWAACDHFPGGSEPGT